MHISVHPVVCVQRATVVNDASHTTVTRYCTGLETFSETFSELLSAGVDLAPCCVRYVEVPGGAVWPLSSIHRVGRRLHGNPPQLAQCGDLSSGTVPGVVRTAKAGILVCRHRLYTACYQSRMLARSRSRPLVVRQHACYCEPVLAIGSHRLLQYRPCRCSGNQREPVNRTKIAAEQQHHTHPDCTAGPAGLGRWQHTNQNNSPVERSWANKSSLSSRSLSSSSTRPVRWTQAQRRSSSSGLRSCCRSWWRTPRMWSSCCWRQLSERGTCVSALPTLMPLWMPSLTLR